MLPCIIISEGQEERKVAQIFLIIVIMIMQLGHNYFQLLDLSDHNLLSLVFIKENSQKSLVQGLLIR